MSTTLVWFRRDLRVADLPTLRHAAERGAAACLFVLDPVLLARRHLQSPPRLRFLREGLVALDRELARRGVRLVVRRGDPAAVVPGVAHEADADLVLWTREVSPLGRARDARVAHALDADRIAHRAMPGDLVVEPNDIEGREGRGYLVFTPFWKTWSGHPLPAHAPAPEELHGPVSYTHLRAHET